MQVIRILFCLLFASVCCATDYTNLSTGTVLANGDTLHYPSSTEAQPWNPTNVPSSPVYAAYEGEFYATNTIAYWPDIGANGYHLTNGTTLGNSYSSESLGSGRYIIPKVSWQQSFLTNYSITLTNPLDVFMVVNPIRTNASAKNVYLCPMPDYTELISAWNTVGLTLIGGVASCGGFTTNTWQIWEFAINGSTTTNYINNVARGSGSLTVARKGMRLNSSDGSSGNPGDLRIAALYIYTNILSRNYATSNYNYWNAYYSLGL